MTSHNDATKPPGKPQERTPLAPMVVDKQLAIQRAVETSINTEPEPHRGS